MNHEHTVEGLRQRDLLDFVEAIASRHHVLLSEVCGSSRLSHVCHARQEIWFVLRTELGWGYEAIGRIWQRHHTTVMNGVAAHTRLALAKASAPSTTKEVA